MNTPFPLGGPPRRPEFDPYAHVGTHRQTSHYVRFIFILAALAIVAKVGWTFWKAFDLKMSAQSASHEPTYGAAAQPVYPATSPQRDAEIIQQYQEAEARAEQSETPRYFPNDAFSEKPKPRPFEDAIVSTESVSTDSSPAGKLDWAKLRQREVTSIANTLRRQCEEWQAEIDQWRSIVEPLLKNDDGKLLADNAENVRSFRAIYDQPRGDMIRPHDIVAVIADLTQNIETALSEPQNAYLPDQAVEGKLRDLTEEARTGAASLRRGREQILILLQNARKQGQVSKKTLSESIAEQETADQIAAIDEAREGMETARRQGAGRVAAAQEEAIRIAGETQAQHIIEAATAARGQQQVEDQRREAELQKQKRIAAMQGDMGDIKRYLEPFITNGYAQPDGYHNTQLADQVPVSWSKLSAAGALKPTREGMEQLMRYATVNNDRPHGGFPQYVGGDYSWAQTNKEFVKRAQELLTTHGEALIASGLLSP